MVHAHLDKNSTSEVTAAAVIANNVIVRGDGGGRGIQGSGVILDDSDNMVIPSSLTLGETAKDVTFTINGSSIESVAALHTSGVTDLGGFVEERHSATAALGAHNLMLRSRGTEGASTVVLNGDIMGRIISCGHDGTDFAQSVEIRTTVDGTPGSDDMPGKIEFFTSPDGSQTPTLGFTLDSTQTVTLGNALPETSGGTGLAVYTAGDVLYSDAANSLATLPIASNADVLTLAAGIPSWATPTVGTVTSVSGTTNRISSTGGATPVIDIDSAYVGQATITTLGTVTTGTWTGTTVAETSGGTGLATYTAGDILYSDSANSLAALAIGSDTEILTLASGLPSWAAPAAGAYDVSDFSGGKFYISDDFLGASGNALGWSTLTANSGTLTSLNVSGHMGSVSLNRATNNNAAVLYKLPSTMIMPFAFRVGYYMSVAVLSDGTDRFDSMMGVLNASPASSLSTDGIYFRYVDDENSGKWLIVCRKDSTETSSDSGITADTGWHYFEIESNAAGTSIAFYIDGTETSNSPITTNIPVSTDTGTFFGMQIIGTDGTSFRPLYFDKFYLAYTP